VTARLRVAVIGGGANGEHEVSLASAAAAAEALDPVRYEAVPFTIDRQGGWLHAGAAYTFAEASAVLAGCDVALPLIHGAPGEDGTLAALCTLVGLPFVGSGIGASAIAMDKQATKLVARSVGVRTALGTLLSSASGDGFAWERPVVVKPVTGGSSQGVTPVHDPADLRAAIKAAFAWSDRVLVEDFVVGREIDIAVFAEGEKLVVSPPLEIRSTGFFDYDAKYGQKHTDEVEFVVPAPLTANELRRLEQHALDLYQALGCRGVARLDFFLDEQGWLLNEVNTTPGFTAKSQVPLMYQAAGIPYPQLLTRLIQAALPNPGLPHSLRLSRDQAL